MSPSLGGGGAAVTTYDFVAKHAMPGPLGFSGSIGLGPTLYVFGGDSRVTPSTIRSTSVYAYDIPTDTWSIKTPMPVPNEWFAYANIGTKIYVGPASQSVIGGTTPTKALYEYDTIAGSWTRRATLVTSDPMSYPRMCAVGTKLYVFSYDTGFHTINVYVWDQATDTWGIDNPSLSIDGGQAPTPMWAGNVGGKVYIIGWPGFPTGSASRTFKFDPSNHVWSILADPPYKAVSLGGVIEDGVGVVVGTDIYALSLMSFPDASLATCLYRYATLTDTWTTVVGRLPNHGIAQLPVTTTGTNLGLGANGRLYFSGGFNATTLVAQSLHWEMKLAQPGGLVLGGLPLN